MNEADAMNRSSKIYVAGHRGLVGSAILRRLEAGGFNNLVTRTSRELDLTRQADVEAFFESERPEYVFLAAAKVGGILANDTRPALFIRDNLLIQTNVIHSAYACGARKLLFLGSSCIYPKLAPQPMKEECLLDGKLEPTNEPYAVAKIAGIKMCQAYGRQYGADFISVMPANPYGPNDNFDLETSHVLPALIRRFHEAKAEDRPAVTIWGSGKPRREFLHVDDLAEACVFLMERYDSPAIINVGTGQDISIGDLAAVVRDIVGYKGDIFYDGSKPDGAPRKLLDVSRLRSLGWKPRAGLREGITITYEWFIANIHQRA
jgi:GDP-L-fucose synthase